MTTYVNPSIGEEHINEKYYNSPNNTFFSFNGSKFYKNGSMKYWVFCHTHESQYGDSIKTKSFEISDLIKRNLSFFDHAMKWQEKDEVVIRDVTLLEPHLK